MTLWGGPPKGALYWGSHNLVNFQFLVSPLRLCLCTYLVLFNWRITLYVKILDLFCSSPPNPTTNLLLTYLGFRIWQLVTLKIEFFKRNVTAASNNHVQNNADRPKKYCMMWARFGGDKKKRMLMVFLLIFPKSSRAEYLAKKILLVLVVQVYVFPVSLELYFMSAFECYGIL